MSYTRIEGASTYWCEILKDCNLPCSRNKTGASLLPRDHQTFCYSPKGTGLALSETMLISNHVAVLIFRIPPGQNACLSVCLSSVFLPTQCLSYFLNLLIYGDKIKTKAISLCLINLLYRLCLWKKNTTNFLKLQLNHEFIFLVCICCLPSYLFLMIKDCWNEKKNYQERIWFGYLKILSNLIIH